MGNAMQSSALYELYRMEEQVRETGDDDIMRDWRKLQTSDHFYYMCTKYWADGDVHKYFSPFNTPVQAFSSYMNILSDFKSVLLSMLDSKVAEKRREKIVEKVKSKK